MVLEDSSSDREPSFSESAPSSDIDPYASDNGTARDTQYIRVDQPNASSIYVNTSSLPMPVFSTARSSPHVKQLTETINSQVKEVAQVVKRPLRQEEADALAATWTRALRVGSYGFYVGGTLAAARIYQTRNKGYRFPGWTPMKEGGRFSPDRFGPLRGQTARAAWSIARSSSYLAVGTYAGQLCFGLYAVSIALGGRLTDPRLREYKEALLKRKPETQRSTGPPKQQNEGEGARAGETYEMARQRSGVQKQVSSQAQARKNQADDMSPTGGAFQQDVDQGQADGGLMDDSQVRTYDYSRRQEEERAAAEEVSNTARDLSQRQARPRGPSATPAESTPSSGGSSWDKLRKVAMSDNQNSSANSRSSGRPKDPPSRNDSFDLPQSDADGRIAKAEAQKEFDAKMERERGGKDFNEERKW